MNTLFRKLGAILAIPVFALMILGGTAKQASAQDQPLIGQLMVFGGNFCPRNWAATDGQLLAISSNSALFSLLGTAYGGDGRSTFGLPDLRGRSIIGVGRGPGLANHSLGSRAGQETHVLSEAQMPSHNHLVNVTNEEANKGGPGNDYLAAGGGQHFQYHDGPANRTMEPDVISHKGGSQPFDIRDPYLTLTTCIALYGIYPSRN